MRDRSLVAGALLSLALFLAVWASVVLTGALSAGDAQLASSIYHLNLGPTLSDFLAAAALYGREYFWGLVILLMLAFGKKELRILAIELGILFVVAILVGDVLKAEIIRLRPPYADPSIVARIPLDADSSFPSGHALIVSLGSAFTLATFKRKWVAALLTVEAAVVSFARVYVGVHYPGDVVAGAALGVAIAFAGLLAERKYLERFLDALFTQGGSHP